MSTGATYQSQVRPSTLVISIFPGETPLKISAFKLSKSIKKIRMGSLTKIKVEQPKIARKMLPNSLANN
jgi:hypothetical protein